MRARALALAVGAAAALAWPAAAQAKFLDVYAGPRFGVAQGGGGGAKRGAVWGVEGGLELILFDAFFDFAEIVGGKDAGASLTQFMLGIDGDLPIDGLSHPRTFVRLGGAAGFALVTPKAPHFPIDDKQVSHKGLSVQGTVALERHLGSFVVVGLEFTLGYRYMLSHDRVQGTINNIDPTMVMDMPPPTPTAAVLNPDHWESSTQAMGLVTARVHFEPLGM